MIPWYAQFSIQSGLGLLTTYVMRRPDISAERKVAFSNLMISVNEFLVELESPPKNLLK